MPKPLPYVVQGVGFRVKGIAMAMQDLVRQQHLGCQDTQNLPSSCSRLIGLSFEGFVRA